MSVRTGLIVVWLGLAGVATAAPPNERCEDATVVMLPMRVDASTHATEVEQVASPCAVEDGYARWYTFTAPLDGTVDDRFTFIVDGTGQDAALDTTLAMFSACDSELPLACSDDLDLALTSRIDTYLDPGQQVWLRVAAWGRQRGELRLTVDRFEVVEAPVNDACEDAIAITQAAPGAAATWNATGSDLSSCGPEDRVDIWYTFTAPSAGEYELAVSQHMIRAHYVAVFDQCGGSELACGFESAKITLAANQTVRVRIGTNPSAADWFNVVVRPGPPAAVPTNDSHEGAIPVAVGSRTLGSTRAATIDPIDDWGIECVSHVNAAIWYRFTAPDADAYVFDTSASALDDTVVALFEDCDSGGDAPPALIVCNDSDGVGDHGRIDGFIEAGASFCVAVAGHFLSEAGDVALDVSRLGPPPPNDACDDALPIEVGEPTFGTNYASVPVDVTTSCPYGNFPLWYSFTAPADGLYKIDTKAGDDAWPDLALYADCGDTEPLACSAEAHPALSRDMHAGETVLVRVSTSLYWRGTIPLRVGPVRVPEVVEPAPEQSPEVIEPAPEPEREPEVAEPEPEVVEPEPGPEPEPEREPEVQGRGEVSGGCGCGGGGAGAASWLALGLLALSRPSRPGSASRRASRR